MLKFADAESSFTDADYVMYGYPFDGTACFRKGTSFGPTSIRRESHNFETYLLELDVDICNISIHDQGDIELTSTVLPFKDDQEENELRLENAIERIICPNKFPIGIGGEHSMTPPIVKKLKEKYSNLSVVVIDAHLDFRNEYEGNKRSHATTTYQLVKLLGKNNVYPVGVRSASKKEIKRANKLKFNFNRDIKSIEGPVYLSLDMDGIDPSYAPGVGTPEPFGISPTDVINIIDRLSDKLVGFDCVETCPAYDYGNTASLAARIIRHVIGVTSSTNRIYEK